MQQALQQALQAKQGEAGKERREGVAASAAPQSETEAQRQQRQAMEQWLQRVPDDPGGLLRRKFQLEYERRQNNGDKDR
jgi:Ca-activated chloride channel family protein